jgi:hypothetical protein
MTSPALTLILAIFGVPFILLGVHIYRDVRGGRRNKEQKCYACGTGGRQLWPVSHNKGGMYLYCAECKSRQDFLLGAFATVGALVVIAFAVVMFLTNG